MDISEIVIQDEAFTADFLQLQIKEDNDLWGLVIESNVEESLEFSDSIELIKDQEEQFFKDAQKYMAAETSNFLNGISLEFL
jgi:hypothetical protein